MSFKTLAKKPRGAGVVTLSVRMQAAGGFLANLYFPIEVIKRLGWNGGRYLVEAGHDEDAGSLRVCAIPPGIDATNGRVLPRHKNSGGVLSIPYGSLGMTADAGRYNVPIIGISGQSITLDITSHVGWVREGQR